MDSVIQKTVTKMNFLTSDEEFQRQYHLREMALSDKTTELNTAIEKRSIEIAQNALRKGFSAEDVKDITGLDIGTVEKLKMKI
jgi:hypothetical protein